MREKFFHRSFYIWLIVLLSVSLVFVLGSTRTVSADINSADEPEVGTVTNDDSGQIPAKLYLNISYKGKVIQNERIECELRPYQKDNLADGQEVSMDKLYSNGSYKPVDGHYKLSDGSEVFPTNSYYLKWNSEKKQLYLTDKDNEIFSFSKTGNSESIMPVQFSKISMGFYYYASNNDDLIGTATATGTLENNKFTIDVPEKPEKFSNLNYDAYSGDYNLYKGSPINLDGSNLSLSTSDDKNNPHNYIFYRNIHLSIPNVGFYRTIYLNDIVYSSRKYTVPSNATTFTGYNESSNEIPKDAELYDTYAGYYIKDFTLGGVISEKDVADRLSLKDNKIYDYGNIDSDTFLTKIYSQNRLFGMYSNGYVTLDYYYQRKDNPKTSSQDVLLHTNLGDKIVRVEGDIPSKDIKVDVPVVEGYKKGSVTASIDESGKITLKDPDGNVNDEKSLYDYVKGTDDSGSSSTPTKPEPSIPSHSSSSVHKVEPTITKKNQLVSTAICKGYVSLYKISGTNISKVTDQALSAFSDWQSDEMVTINGEKYYRVATNKWVKGQNVYVYQPLDTVVKTKQNLVYMKNDEFNNITNRALAANSSWKVDRIAYLERDSTPYYRVSTNEFVRKDDINIGN